MATNAQLRESLDRLGTAMGRPNLTSTAMVPYSKGRAATGALRGAAGMAGKGVLRLLGPVGAAMGAHYFADEMGLLGDHLLDDEARILRDLASQQVTGSAYMGLDRHLMEQEVDSLERKVQVARFGEELADIISNKGAVLDMASSRHRPGFVQEMVRRGLL